MALSISKVGVVGTGVIGASWIGLFLASGREVLVSDPAPGAQKALETYLHKIWPTLERLSLGPGASLSKYRFVGASLQDHLHENAPEQIDLKTKLIGEIDAGTRPDVVIASSSSGLPSSQFISKCKHPERVLIGHPFNPPHLMPLVEVVPHIGTSETAVRQAMALYDALGKRPVLVRQETPGFAANRLQTALCNEAYSLVKRGILSAEDVDACVTTSLGPRWAFTGPFMSNVMGGGGGKEGFKHLMEHVGMASKVWTDDMKAHAFETNASNIDLLDQSVQKMLEHRDVKEMERQRDEQLLKLLKAKADASELV